jgi:uncharacterized membrane protein YhaH (DUF805 family)
MSERLQEVTAGGRDPVRNESGWNWLNGRANRREYWLFAGPLLIVAFASGAFSIPGVDLVAGLGLTLITIRRLHDLGRSGWWVVLINIVSRGLQTGLTMAMGDNGAIYAGLIAIGMIVAVGAVPGQSIDNQFGPSKARKTKLSETFS